MTTEFLKFIVIGVLSTCVNYASFYILLDIINTHYLIASGAGFCIGVIVGYFFNRTWTFKISHRRHTDFLNYLGVYLFSLALSLVLLTLLVEGVLIPAKLANVLVLGVTTLINFLGIKYLVFNKKTPIKCTKKDHFIRISKEIGSQCDYVQGGGGNTSVKLDKKHMLIKASGTWLADMSNATGYTVIDYPKIRNSLHHTSESSASTMLNTAVVTSPSHPTGRPSMETGFHTLLHDTVIHSHSIYANIINCTKHGQSILHKIFKNTPFSPIWIPYVSPGLQLTLAIQKKCNILEEMGLFFLENHGIIVSHNSSQKALAYHAQVNDIIIKALNLPKFHTTLHLKREASQHFSASYTSPFSQEDLQKTVLFPDQTIYLSKQFNIKENRVHFYASEKKTMSMLQTLRAVEYILTTCQALNYPIQTLHESEISFLHTMPSEAYRKQVLK